MEEQLYCVCNFLDEIMIVTGDIDIAFHYTEEKKNSSDCQNFNIYHYELVGCIVA